MTCDYIQPLLSSYHDEALSFEQRAQVRGHVATCASCRAVLSAYEQMYATLREATAGAPAELRRNVYAHIAELEARRGSLLPFGPSLLGLLRTTGGTAGLLAVLAALVFAATRLNGAQRGNGGAQVAAGPQLRAAGTTVSRMLGALQRGGASSLPAPEQTAIAPVGAALSRSAGFISKGTRKSGHDVAVNGLIVHTNPSGAPRDTQPVQVVVAPHIHGPSIKSAAVGRPAPLPTIAAGDRLVYLHLDSDSIWRVPSRNAAAQVEWHPLLPGTEPLVVATPAPTSQLFTGVAASLDGYTVAYSVMGMGPWGGVFGFSTTALRPQPMRLFSLPDRQRPNTGYWHYYVKQIYPAVDGRLLFSVIDNTPARNTASVVITTSSGAAPRTQLVAPIRQPWYDYVVSPDRRSIIWTSNPDLNFDTWRLGTLQVANLQTTPATRTIGIGAHPIWSPNGDSILYLSDHPAGLYIWSARDDKSRRVVALGSGGRSFISGFTWAPGGRYFAYVLTHLDPRGSSEVRLADSQTGYTWPAFTRRFIGAIAWAHGPASAAATPRSPLATPARYDSMASPAQTLRSFYNAINRRDYARAFSYIRARDRTNFRKFAGGYTDTLATTITRLLPAPYLHTTPGHATTCVGFALLAHHKDGHNVRFGGWYMLQSTAGQNPRFAGWRIVMDDSGTHIKQGGLATAPPLSQCKITASRQPAVTLNTTKQ